MKQHTMEDITNTNNPTPVPPIPDWIIKYDQANHQSSAGKAIRFLMQRIKELEQGRHNVEHADNS
jgi:hypothetical protein